ncbi:MAG: hypothetical protein V3T05_02715 [Myxococcota bacterium]
MDGGAPTTCSSECDVDLAVTGLSHEQYFEALAALMAHFACAVDLVEIESAGDSLRARIEIEGRSL